MANLVKKRQAGYTLIELVAVCAILLIVSTIAIIAFQRVIDAYKMSAAGHSVASLILQCRIQAVRSNLPAYVRYDNSKTPNMVYVTNDPSNLYVAGIPDVEINPGLSMQPGSPPNHEQLDSYLGIDSSNPVSPVLQTVNYIGFNARGLPCVLGAGGTLQCIQQDSGNRIPVFEWFIQGPRSSWEAITVTAAGRVKSWRLTTNNSSASTACGFNACWQ